MNAKRLALCAVTTALLIAIQYVLGFVSGVELVTAFFLCFCYVFGVRCGAAVGIAFSLLRCLIYGFFPNVILLYLLYYSLFAVVFGLMGERPALLKLCPAIALAIMALSGYFAVRGVPISALYKTRVRVMLWVIFGLTAVILIFYLIAALIKKAESAAELASVTSAAVFMTVLFTLLDDVITPLTMGYSAEAAAGYFYGGFLAMLPQTVCAAVSVFLLFRPLKSVFSRFKNQISQQNPNR